MTAKLEEYFTRFNWLNCACPQKLCEGVACHGQITLNKLMKQINNLLKKQIEPIYAEPRPGDIMHSFASIELIQKYLNFKPIINFIESLNKTEDNNSK